MAQLNLYVSDDLAARLKGEARRAGVPLSRYVLSLLAPSGEPAWPGGYFENVCGFLADDLPEPEDHAPEAVDLPESLQ